MYFLPALKLLMTDFSGHHHSGSLMMIDLVSVLFFSIMVYKFKFIVIDFIFFLSHNNVICPVLLFSLIAIFTYCCSLFSINKISAVDSWFQNTLL